MTTNAKALKVAEKYMGREIREVVAGVRGICNLVSLQPTGIVMLGIQPEVRDGARPESHLHDETIVDIVSPGISDRLPKPQMPAFKIGDRVRHKSAPFEGDIISVSWHVSGCVQYGVTPSHLSDKGRVIFEALLEQECEKVGKANKALADTEQTNTGGPSARAVRAVR